MLAKEIILAAPRGFCAGVNRAIEIVHTALDIYQPPIYVNHEIVHNKYVVETLINKGVLFTENVNEIPEYSTVIFSAHGVAPIIREIAKKRHFNVIDATCPLVTKVHLEAIRYSQKGYHILLIGRKNHVETIGTSSEAADVTTIIETIDDIDALQFSEEQPLVYLTQTTLSLHDTKQMIQSLTKKFPWIESPNKSDICYATTNRQDVIREMSSSIDILLVIGSLNSSNSNRLKELGESLGIPSYLIENQKTIDTTWFPDDITKIGVTAGASVPEKLVQETVSFLKKSFTISKIREYISIEENITFKMPKKLTELLHV